MAGRRFAALGALALLTWSCGREPAALDKAGGPAPPTAPGALDLSRISVAPLGYAGSRARLVAAGRSVAGLKPTEQSTFLQDAEQENLNGKPFPSGAPIFLLACSGEFSLPDRFTVTAATRSGNRLVVEAEERRFGNWSQAPKGFKNEVRSDAAVIPLGTLPDGDYEAELIVTRCWFQDMAHPEKAAQPERKEVRGGEPIGPTLCLFTVGKLSAPRLTEVSAVVRGGAHRTFHANGLVQAGHMSGSREAPMVHMETTWAPREEIAAIWKAAAALNLEALAKKYPGDEPARHVSLKFALPDGAGRSYFFPMGAAELKELEDLLHKKSYGAW